MKIKLQDLTPDIYYRKSRDFQFIGRLYDVVLNSVKTNADLIYNVPLNDNSDNIWLDLMSYTLGFQPKHNYNVKQLKAICNAFSEIIHNKGNTKAIQLAGRALANADGLTEDFICYIDHDPENPYNLVMALPAGLSDTTLLEDLMNYILPAGMTYRLIPNFNVLANYGASNSGINSSIGHWKPNASEVSVVYLKETDPTAPAAQNRPGLFINSAIIVPTKLPKENNQGD